MSSACSRMCDIKMKAVGKACVVVIWVLALPGTLGNPEWPGPNLGSAEWTGSSKEQGGGSAISSSEWSRTHPSGSDWSRSHTDSSMWSKSHPDVSDWSRTHPRSSKWPPSELNQPNWPQASRSDRSQVNLSPWVQVPRFSVPRYVAVGVNMSLECDYLVQPHATLYSLKWYKSNSQFYQYIPSNAQPHAVFDVPGLQHTKLIYGREGRQVTVVEVGVAASDVYRCELVAEGPPFHTTQRSANMTVIVVPRGSPTIQGSQGHYQVGQWLDMVCTSPPARPPPDLTWTLNGHQISGSSIHFSKPIETPSGLETVTTHLEFQVNQHHFKGGAMTIVCEARLADLYFRSHQVIIPDPSTTWFSTLNLYSSGCQELRTTPATFWVVLVAMLQLSLQLLLL